MNKTTHTYDILIADLRAMAIEENHRLGNLNPSERDIQAMMNTIRQWPIIQAAFEGAGEIT